jgi:hypothetical protein
MRSNGTSECVRPAVADACRRLAPAPQTMVMVESIGNLV